MFLGEFQEFFGLKIESFDGLNSRVDAMSNLPSGDGNTGCI